MKQVDLINKISELEREIAVLPEGSISRKCIRGKDYYYHRINRNGKRTETYIKFEDVSGLEDEINKRKRLEKTLKELTKALEIEESNNVEVEDDKKFNTIVRFGKSLASQIAPVSTYKTRFIIDKLRDYIHGVNQDKVFILYGLRRTGKTTMIRQVISELTTREFNRTAFIQVTTKDTLSDLDHDIRLLERMGFKNVFIDEVTLMDGFIEGAAIFSDVYASSGMKIVLSGTDSLGFAIAQEEQLYDRAIVLHTTYIPYYEFEEVLRIKGIDEYIRFDGTMSISGRDYNGESIFGNSKNTKQYIDSAIAKNIQHSLSLYEYGGHFRELESVHERGELTNVINRVIEDINHKFTRNVIERTFMSNDLGITSNNLLKDGIVLSKKIDVDEVNSKIKTMLDILNKEEQKALVDDSILLQIKEYLVLLDLINEIDLEYLPDIKKSSKINVIAQPGLRYSQASVIVNNMLKDDRFKALSASERKYILDRLLSEIKGRMMEEIVLLETKLLRADKHVFKLQFAVGEFDMVVADEESLEVSIYEIKYSKNVAKEQYRHLIDKNKCELTTHRYGTITNKCVIYLGDNTEVDGIKYLNVEEYLKGLKTYL